ncbi:MAG: glycosyltransferase family 39 protein, partial [Planctomycetota bacterium]
LARTVIESVGDDQRKNGAAVVGALVLLTVPWAIVTGSSAYNEGAVNLMLAAGMACVLRRDINASPWRQGLLIALVCAAAVLSKPTALFFVPTALTVLMLIRAFSRSELWAIGWAAPFGLIMLSPWLLRNTIATGNPVFPYAAGVFGSGHWTNEQVERWVGGHHFDGSLLDRIGMLASERGFWHEQWMFAVLGPVVLACFVIGLAKKDTRRLMLALAGALGVQLVAWLLLTHLQSRFLMPMLVVMALVVGLGVQGLAHRAREGVAIVVGIAIVGISMFTVYSPDDRGESKLGMLAPFTFDASAIIESVPPGSISPQEIPTSLALAIMLPDRTDGLYLLGDATPLYMPDPLVWHTTWDRSPIAEAMDNHEYTKATETLRELGAGYVLINFGELQRLHRSGWYAPEVTVDRVQEFLRVQGEVLIAWPDRGQVLMRLNESEVSE